MTTLLLLLSLLPAPKATTCVTAHLLDGRTVVMCAGHVTSVADQLGNVRTTEGK